MKAPFARLHSRFIDTGVSKQLSFIVTACALHAFRPISLPQLTSAPL
jgi:hypothetical protein